MEGEEISSASGLVQSIGPSCSDGLLSIRSQGDLGHCGRRWDMRDVAEVILSQTGSQITTVITRSRNQHSCTFPIAGTIPDQRQLSEGQVNLGSRSEETRLIMVGKASGSVKPGTQAAARSCL